MTGKQVKIQIKKSDKKTHREPQPINTTSWSGKKEHKN